MGCLDEGVGVGVGAGVSGLETNWFQNEVIRVVGMGCMKMASVLSWKKKNNFVSTRSVW